MIKYFKIFLALFSIETKKYLENRVNTFGSVIISAASLGINILLITIIFSFTKNINGWTKEQVFFLTGIYRIFITTFSLFFLRSLNSSGFMIANGDLDWFLCKPANSQFLTTFRQIRSFEIINLLPGLALTVYALDLLHYQFQFFDVLVLTFLLFCGLIILYGILFSISTATFYIGKFESMSSVNRIISEPLGIPTDFFGQTAAFALTFIIPLGFITTIPVKIFLGEVPIYFGLFSLFFASLLLYISHHLWDSALKRYTSANS